MRRDRDSADRAAAPRGRASARSPAEPALNSDLWSGFVGVRTQGEMRTAPLLLALAFPVTAAADEPVAPTYTVDVRERRPVSAASAFVRDSKAFELRSVSDDPGDLLEVTPGLEVGQHAGGGKANQYLIRGFDADHGTDIALFVDGVPGQHPQPRARPGLRRLPLRDPGDDRAGGDHEGSLRGRDRRLRDRRLGEPGDAPAARRVRREVRGRLLRRAALPADVLPDQGRSRAATRRPRAPSSR